jgi:ATP adenylyltransferase
MEHLWSPWRFKYVANADHQEPGCVFCKLPADVEDEKNHIIYRDSLNFIILNLFPYTSGHLMIVPYQHEPSLPALPEDATVEMMRLAKRALVALETEYHPDGFNVGLNLGHSAGAGVAGHLHLHVVPRWTGDANFLSTLGETRVIPEDLPTTYAKLKKHFAAKCWE